MAEALTLSPELEFALRRHWQSGLSIGATRKAIEHTFGQRPEFELVRQRFVEFANGGA